MYFVLCFLTSDNTLIKAVLCDFDQTLSDTREAKPYWKCGKPDWKTAYSKIPECPFYDSWRYTLAALRRLPFGIVSHNTKRFIDSVLRYYKVQEFSPFIGRYGEGSRPFLRALPQTTLFEQALQHEGFFGLEPNEILYLGDEARDSSRPARWASSLVPATGAARSGNCSTPRAPPSDSIRLSTSSSSARNKGAPSFRVAPALQDAHRQGVVVELLDGLLPLRIGVPFLVLKT